MALPQDNISMALFCDFENVALGVRDAKYDKFDIKKVLERLLLKGSIVVKKAYCDWDRYRTFKGTMHEANFELIEIPHVRQSGKNSADIRMVVDALDLCYTKSHVNTFVIISGDSDFSPLVSKLRENAKYVIGVGVKQSTSDLLTANCDEFIFYDDLVREGQRMAARRESRESQPSSAPRRSPEEERRRKEEMDARRIKAIEMAVETYEGMVTDRDDGGKIWASVLKEALKRRNPGFSESYYGYRTFGNLLEDAQARGLLEFGRDEKSGAYVYRHHGASPRVLEAAPLPAHAPQADRGQERSADRGHEPRQERGRDRPQDRHAEHGGEAGADRGGERGGERGQDRQAERAHDRGDERGGERGAERGRDRHQQRGRERGQDRQHERTTSPEAHAASEREEAAADGRHEPNLDRPEAQPQPALEPRDRAPSSRGRRRRRGEGEGAAAAAEASPVDAAAFAPPPEPVPERVPAAGDGERTQGDEAQPDEEGATRRPARGARKPAAKKAPRAAKTASGRAARPAAEPAATPAAAPREPEAAPQSAPEPAAKKASRSRRPRKPAGADE